MRRSVVLVVVMATTIWLAPPASGGARQPDLSSAAPRRATVGTAAAACTWTTAPSVKGNRSLFTVAPLSPSNAWAAGITTSLGTQALIEHWNGKRWSVSPTPAMTASGINALAAISATDVWAVGYAGQGPTSAGGVNYKTLVEHWNGASWEVIPSPNPAGTKSNALVGLAAISPTDVWAVGYTLIGSTRQGLTEHWNGSAWTVVASPDPGTLSNGLLDIEASSSTNAIAVGYRSDGYGYQTLAERWDGSAWTVVPSPSPGSVDNVLTGLAVNSATDAWAVGYLQRRRPVPDVDRALGRDELVRRRQPERRRGSERVARSVVLLSDRRLGRRDIEPLRLHGVSNPHPALGRRILDGRPQPKPSRCRQPAGRRGSHPGNRRSMGRRAG